MDRQPIAIILAILLAFVGPRAMVEGLFTPDQLETRLLPHLGTVPKPPGPCALHNSSAGDRGDIHYLTFDQKLFRFNSPPWTLSVGVLSWVGSSWFVLASHEYYPIPPTTRVKDGYIKCSGMYFAAKLGHAVILWKWNGAAWIVIGPGVHGVNLVANYDGGYRIDCTGVPMVVWVHRHGIFILLDYRFAADCWGVRGCLGDFNGDPNNDVVKLDDPPPPLGTFIDLNIGEVDITCMNKDKQNAYKDNQNLKVNTDTKPDWIP